MLLRCFLAAAVVLLLEPLAMEARAEDMPPWPRQALCLAAFDVVYTSATQALDAGMLGASGIRQAQIMRTWMRANWDRTMAALNARFDAEGEEFEEIREILRQERNRLISDFHDGGRAEAALEEALVCEEELGYAPASR